MPTAPRTIHAPSSTAERDAQSRFLAELVKVPSDNPPGDCAPPRRARRRAARGLGFDGRAPPGAGGAGARQRHDQRHQPRRPPALRRRPGDRAQRPWRRRAARRGLDPGPLRRRDRRRLDVRPRRRGLEVGFRDLRLRAAGARGGRGAGASSPARSSCTSPTTRRPAARSARAGCSSRASASPTRARRRLLLRRRHRPQRLPASRGAGRRPLGARRHALHRRRRAGGRDPHARPPLRLAQDAGRAAVGHRRASAARSSRSG